MLGITRLRRMVMWRCETLHSTESVGMNCHCSVFWTWKQRSRGIGRPKHWPWFGFKLIMKDVEVVVTVNKLQTERQYLFQQN